MERLLVIQEHHSKGAAGLHWDLRLEAEGDISPYIIKRNETNEPKESGNSKVLKSFAIPKARLPEIGEILLAVPTEDHPWEYKDFEGEITGEYGRGMVKLLYSGPCELLKWDTNCIKFRYNKQLFTMFPSKKKHWFIRGCKDYVS